MARNIGAIHQAILAEGVNLGSVRGDTNLQFFRPDGAAITSGPDYDACMAIAAKADDYVIIKDGVTELDEDDEITITANDVAAKTFTVQYKNADDSNGTGDGEAVEFHCVDGGLLPIDKLDAVLDGNGRATFTMGPTDRRGRCCVRVDVSPLPSREVRIKFA